uniref:Gustatory receptor n=1 Tax=Strigamia maritima TaxID=126957 RepID=T1JLM9_STRMM
MLHIPVISQMHEHKINYNYLNHPISHAWNSKRNVIYKERLKFIWKLTFSPYGIDVYKGNCSRGKKLIMLISALIQLIIILHQLLSIIYTLAFGLSILQLTFYTTLTVGTFSSVYSLWTLYRKRIAVAKLLNNTIDQWNDRAVSSKKVWKCTLVTCLGLFTMSIGETLCTLVDISSQNTEGIQIYAAVYFFGVQLAEEHPYIARMVIAVEFFIVLLVCGQFVNISVCFFIQLCHVSFFRFNRLNAKVERLLTSGRQLTSFELHEYRQQHQHACEVTKELSSLWSPLMVVWLLGFIFSLLFDLRALWKSNSTLFLIGYSIDISKQLWLLIGLYKVASIVNTEAHQLGEKLVTLSLSQPTKEFTQADQMNYYVNYLLLSQRLISTRVGITVSGLFLLNTSSFLAMTGTVLTYIIVLYQST